MSNNEDIREVMWKAAVGFFSMLLALFIMLVVFAVVGGCSPKVVTRVEKIVEYRDREIHDTTTFEIPVEVEKIVTHDTVSHLENTYAKSDAVVSQGFLSHSLESIPQIIKVPYEVHVTDTLYKESQVITETVEVEKPLTWWQRFRIGAFWWLLGCLAAALGWIFRKPLKNIICKLV